MTDNLLLHLRSVYHDLNQTEQKIANFVFSKGERVESMSISELAAMAGVSVASVTRFCRKLSLPGFFAFKLELAKVYLEKDSSNKKENTALSQKISAEAHAAIDDTLSSVSEEDILSAVKMIERAERVVSVGYGSTSACAMEFVSVFSAASLKFSFVSDVHNQMATVSLMTEKDLLILFSYSGATVEGTELLRFAKERGIPTLLVTHFAVSPSAEFADRILTHAVDEHPYRAGSVPVRIAELLLIDLLWRNYKERNKKICKENALRISDSLAKKHV